MTYRAARPGPGIPRIWLIPISIAVVVLAATSIGLLSRSLVLDLAAWWVVWLVLVILALLAPGRRIGRVKLVGLVPILATLAFVVFLTAHISGWSMMPSATSVLVGPVVEQTESATMTADVDGRLVVDSTTSFLYEVIPLRLGGKVGIPTATENVSQSSISVILDQPSDPGFYGFYGWDLALSPLVEWSLVLEGEIEADLAELTLRELRLAGDGTVTLPAVGEPRAVEVVGAYELVISDDIPARLLGDWPVPDTWVRVTDGWESPAGRSGWVISVSEGGALTVSNG